MKKKRIVTIILLGAILLCCAGVSLKSARMQKARSISYEDTKLLKVSFFKNEEYKSDMVYKTEGAGDSFSTIEERHYYVEDLTEEVCCDLNEVTDSIGGAHVVLRSYLSYYYDTSPHFQIFLTTKDNNYLNLLIFKDGRIVQRDEKTVVPIIINTKAPELMLEYKEGSGVYDKLYEQYKDVLEE